MPARPAGRLQLGLCSQVCVESHGRAYCQRQVAQHAHQEVGDDACSCNSRWGWGGGGVGGWGVGGGGGGARGIDGHASAQACESWQHSAWKIGTAERKHARLQGHRQVNTIAWGMKMATDAETPTSCSRDEGGPGFRDAILAFVGLECRRHANFARAIHHAHAARVSQDGAVHSKDVGNLDSTRGGGRGGGSSARMCLYMRTHGGLERRQKGALNMIKPDWNLLSSTLAGCWAQWQATGGTGPGHELLSAGSVRARAGRRQGAPTLQLSSPSRKSPNRHGSLESGWSCDPSAGRNARRPAGRQQLRL
jgi:hypothetical protein